MVTKQDLRTISKKRTRSGKPGLFLAAFNEYAGRYDVVTPINIAKFLANVCVETGGFTSFTESLNYSVSGLKRTFGSHRISRSDCEKYGRTKSRRANQKMIANIIYGGPWGRKNLGNTQSGDGWKFRGRGPGQVTGRAHYTKITKLTGIDFINKPHLMADPKIGTKAMLIVWRSMKMNERDPGRGRRRWNGGSHGYNEFQTYYKRAKKLNLSVEPQKITTPTFRPEKPKSDDPFVAEAAAAFENNGVAIAQTSLVTPDVQPRRPQVTALAKDIATEGRFSTEKATAGLAGASLATASVAEIFENIKSFVPDWFLPMALSVGLGGVVYWWWRRSSRQKRAKKALEV